MGTNRRSSARPPGNKHSKPRRTVTDPREMRLHGEANRRWVKEQEKLYRIKANQLRAKLAHSRLCGPQPTA